MSREKLGREFLGVVGVVGDYVFLRYKEVPVSRIRER
jgi:hypothetical protein